MSDKISLTRNTPGPLFVNMDDDRKIVFMSRKPRMMTVDEYLEVSSHESFRRAVENGYLKVDGLPDDIDRLRSKFLSKNDPVPETKENQFEWDDHIE